MRTDQNLTKTNFRLNMLKIYLYHIFIDQDKIVPNKIIAIPNDVQYFSCKCSHGKKKGSVYWTFNGQNNLPINSHIISSSTSYLILTRLEKQNDGIYECECQLNMNRKYFAEGRLVVRGTSAVSNVVLAVNLPRLNCHCDC